MTLDEHLKKFAEGDDSDFGAFYLATKKPIYHIALGIVRDRALAEDVMQNTYMKVLAGAGSYKRGTNASAWIARIARMRESPVDERENEHLFPVAKPDEYGLLTDVARRILSEDEFTVLMLAAADGYKRREIAAMLKMPLPTVTWKYHQALAKMRRALEGGKA